MMDLKSGYPFWLIKNGLPYDYPQLSESIKTDVVILGGGISGALTAYHLINKGIACVVLDARTIGLGSTCTSTSLLQYEIDTPLSKLVNIVGYKNAVRSYQLCRESIHKLGSIADKIGFKDFEFRNSLYYAPSGKDTEFLKEEFSIRSKNGFKVELLNHEAVKSQFGFSAASAILSADGAQTNAYMMTHALHQYGIKKGLQVFDRSPVTSIKHRKNGVVLKTQAGHKVEAIKMVYANGYEVVNYIDKKIVKLNSTYAVISQHFETSSLFWKDKVMIWNTDQPYLYIRTTADNRIIVGGRDEQFYNPRKRDRLLAKKTNQIVKDFKKLFPAIPFQAEFSWTGTFGATEDGLPFIGEYSRLPNSYFALGFGGNGITFSLIAAEIITDLVLGKENGDASIFSFQRT